MKTFVNIKKYLFICIAIFLWVSCDDDDNNGNISDNTQRTIVELSRQTTTLSTLIEALSVADGNLISLLDGSEPYTVFAPDNGAFDNLATLIGFSDTETMLQNIDRGLLAEILRYQIVAGVSTSSSLQNRNAVQTLQGEEIIINKIDNNDFQVLDKTELSSTSTFTTVTARDQIALNGVVHFTDKVLLSENIINAFAIDIRPNLFQLVADTPSLSLLGEALIMTSLDGVLSGDNGGDGFTVFAPTDDNFGNLLTLLGDNYNALEDFDNSVERALLSEILLYHVIPEALNSSELEPGELSTALDNNTIQLVPDGSSFSIDDQSMVNANITAIDIGAYNGVAHTIDNVLIPQSVYDFIDLLGSDDLEQIVTATSSLSILMAALEKTQLTSLFIDDSNEGENEPDNFTYFREATVFAPSNTAFQDLFDALGSNYNSIDDFENDEEIALLTDILLYHTISGEITSENLSVGTISTSLENGNIEVIARGSGFVLGDVTNDVNAAFINTDIEARNGIAHIIDKVLLPASAVAFIDNL